MELHGERVILNMAGKDDAADLLPAFNGDERFTDLSGGPPTTLEAAQADIIETLGLPGGTVWRFTATKAGSLVGMATTALVPPPDNAWIAFFIVMRPFQRQGFGSEAAALLERHFFTDLAVARHRAARARAQRCRPGLLGRARLHARLEAPRSRRQ